MVSPEEGDSSNDRIRNWRTSRIGKGDNKLHRNDAIEYQTKENGVIDKKCEKKWKHHHKGYIEDSFHKKVGYSHSLPYIREEINLDFPLKFYIPSFL